MSELGAVVETGAVAAVEIAASALAERGHEPKPCPNCGKPMIGPFCAVCGQPYNTHRRSLKHLIHEFVTDIISFDSRILRTTRALLFEPGELPKAFREGRTQPFVPAVRLYLFVSLLFFLFLSATGLTFVQLGLQVQSVVYTHDQAGNVYKSVNGKKARVPELRSDAAGNLSLAGPAGTVIEVPKDKADGHSTTNTVTTRIVFFERRGSKKLEVTPDVRKNLDQVNKEIAAESKTAGNLMRGVYATVTKLETDPAALNGPLTTWIPRILFVLVPLFAALLMAFYIKRRSEFLYVDHLVFSLTMHSFAFVVLIAAAVVAQVMSAEWVALAAWFVLSLYFLISLKHFYRQGWPATVLKFSAVATIYALFFLFPALLFALVMSIVAGD